MAQVADVIAFLFRRKLELEHYGMPESYQGERSKLKAWLPLVEPSFVPFKDAYPKRGGGLIALLQAAKAKGI
jgi:hypothetical protein